MTKLEDGLTTKYKITAKNNNESYEHGLNVCLHDYQLQSLQWMIDEENDSIGFYRHFYKKGMFADDSSFFYSAIFNEMMINESLPVAHGGFLCEEMGLGKSIISLALINCNKPKNLNGYSTKNHLIIEMRENHRKSTLNSSDHGYVSETFHTEEYKWYKSQATLVIASPSSITQWEKEYVKRCDGAVNYVRYYDSYRSRDIKKYIDKDIVFTTYGILGKEDGDDRSKHVLHKIYWHRIILDESHNIKSSAKKATKHIKLLRAANKWCLASTPFGTSIYDIHNQLEFIGMKQNHLNRINLKTISKKRVFTGSRGELKDFDVNECDVNALLKVIQSMVMRHTRSQKFNGKQIVSMLNEENQAIAISNNAQNKNKKRKRHSMNDQKDGEQIQKKENKRRRLSLNDIESQDSK